MHKNNILLNLSRIGKDGTGLFVYSEIVSEILNKYFRGELSLLIAKNINIKGNSQSYYVPELITMTSAISYLRPIFWYFYSKIFSPTNYTHTISTTHHTFDKIKKQIITVHDLRPYYYPDSFIQKAYFKYLLSRILKKVDGIITVSNATKKDIVRIYHINPNKVYVVPNCVDLKKFFPSKEKEKKPYILLVGATWYHKNAHELLENSDLWADKYKLKILAGTGIYKEQLKIIVRNRGLVEQVEFLEYVTQQDLITLYQEATALVYPSLLEGFGIPPLEAMACATPVIVSNIEVFKECYGDCPIYVDLGSRLSWEKAFKHLCNTEIIDKKIDMGGKKVREYTFSRTEDYLMKAIYAIWPELRK